MVTATTPTAADYRAAFQAERQREYRVIDAFESRCGYRLDRARLEEAAAVLACPVKKSPPNWQHGRVLYALTRKYLEDRRCAMVTQHGINILDIGTAKGFSALCLRWALDDSAYFGSVRSVDVINPYERVARNTVAEVDELLTLHDTLRPWPDAAGISFVQSTGVGWLTAISRRIHIAFIDGTHNGAVVREEGRLLSERQEQGDLAMFDDVDRSDIRAAVESLSDVYRLEYIEVLPNRHYAIGVRR